MSYTVDNRVVEMEFDNKEFEQNVKTTMSTLDKLKAALKLDKAAESFNNLDKAAKGVTLDGINDSIERVEAKFSAFEVFSNQIIRNLANSFYSLGQSIAGTVKSLSVDQISEGFGKYEQKVEAVQQIMNATGHDIDYVNERLEKLMWFSDETSYSFTDMASNIGKFTSAGVDLDEATTAMMGIANWAAVSGANAQTASRAMYNLSQALGMGKLTMMDWKSIENANMATKEFKEQAIQAGIAAGTLKEVAGEVYTADGKMLVTAENMRDSLQKGWFNKEAMMDVLTKYGQYTEAVYEIADSYDTCAEAMEHVSDEGMELSSKAFHAAQEAKTWTDVLNATKDAVSSSWMSTFELIFGNYQEAKETWTDITGDFWELFAAGGVARNRMLKEAFSGDYAIGGIEKEISKAGISLDKFYDEVSNVLMKNGRNVQGLIDEYGSLRKAMQAGAISSGNIKSALKSLIPTIDSTGKKTEKATASLEEIQGVVKGVLRGDYGNGSARRTALTELGYDYEKIQNLANRMHAGGKITEADLEGIKTAIEEVEESTDEQVEAFRRFVNGTDDATDSLDKYLSMLGRPSGRELFIGGLQNILKSIVGVVNSFREASSVIFGDSSERAAGLYRLVAAFNMLTSKLEITEERGEKLKRAFSGVLSIFKLIGFAGKSLLFILSPIAKAFGRATNGVGNFVASLGDIVTNFVETVIHSKRVEKAIVAMANGVEAAVGFIETVISKVSSGINWLVNSSYWQEFVGKCKLIGQAISDWIAPYISKAETLFGDLLDWFKNLNREKVEGFFQRAKTAIGKFWSACRQVKDAISEFVSPYFQQAKDAIEKFLGPIGQAISKIVTLAVETKKTQGTFAAIKAVLSSVADGIRKVKNRVVSFVRDGGLKNLWDGLLEKFQLVRDKLAEIISTMKQKLEEADWGKIMTGAGVFTVLVILLELATAMDRIGAAFKSFSTLSSTMTDFLNNINKAMNTTPIQKLASAVMVLALSVAVLAGSVYLISKVDNPWKAFGVIAALTALMAAVAGTLGVLSKKGFFGSLKDLAILIGAMAASVLILSFAIKNLADIPLPNLANALGAFAVLILGLGSVGTALALYAPQLSKGSFALIGIAAAVYLLTLALQRMSKLMADDSDNMIKAMDQLAKVMLMLAVVAAASSFVGAGAGIGLLGGVLAIIGIIEILKRLADPELQGILKTALSNIKTLIGIGAIFASLALILTAVGKFAGKDVLRAGTGLLAAVVALVVVVKAIEMIGRLPLDVAEQGIEGVQRIIIGFMGLLVAMQFVNANAKQGAQALLLMSASLFVVYLAVKRLGAMDSEQLAKGMAAVLTVFTMFALLQVASRKVGKAGPILAMAVSLAMVVAAIAALTLYDWEDLIRAVAMLRLVMIAFGKAVKTMSGFKGSLKVPDILALTLPLLILAGALVMLAKENWASVLSAGFTMAACVGAMALVLKYASSMSKGNILPTAASIAVVVGAIWLIALALEHLRSVPGEQLLSTAVSISAILLALAAVTWVMAKVPPMNAIAGTAGLVASGTIILAAALIIGALVDQLDKHVFNGAIEAGLDKLITVCGKIGEAAGTLVSGIGVGLSSGLPAIGSNLGAFAENAKPFFDLAKDAASSGADIGALCSGILKLTEANLLNKLTSFFKGGDLESFGTKLTSFANGLKGYLDIVTSSEFDASKIESSVQVVEALAKVTQALPGQGRSVISFFTGRKDLAEFGTSLKSFATSLVEYSVSLGGMDPNAVQNVQNSVQIITDLANATSHIEKVGGIVGALEGENDAGAFGEALSTLGYGIRMYAVRMSTVSEDAVETTKNKLLNFIEMMKQLAGADIEAGRDKAKFVTQFARELQVAAPILVSAAATVAGINLDAINEMIEAVNQLANVGGTLQSLANVLSTNLRSVIVAEMESTGGEVAEAFCSAFVSGIIIHTQDATSAAEAMSRSSVSSTDVSGAMMASGASAGASFADGVASQIASAANAGRALAAAAVRASGGLLRINSPSKVFEQQGIYSGEGYINGIRKMYSKVSDATSEMAEGAYSSANLMLNRAMGLLNSNMALNPTITPVLDLTNVQYGAQQIDSLLMSTGRTINLSGALDSASASASSISRRLSSRIESSDDYSTQTASRAPDSLLVSPTINIYPSEGMDENALASMVIDKMQDMYVRKGVSMG